MTINVSSRQAELIVADGLCPAIATLLPAGLHPVEALGAEPEPLQAIGDVLQQHPGVQTLHLVAHGAPGGFWIGGRWIDRRALSANAEILGHWGVERIALWCCDTGADREFVTLLAELTGADVLDSATSLVGGAPEVSWRLGDGAGAMAAPFQSAQIGSWPYRLGVAVTPIPIASPGRTNQENRNLYAFAALKVDGSVVTWGNPLYGGDSLAVATHLSSGVTQIFSTASAFAALKADGSVVTWGKSRNGGNSSGVASQLSSGVAQISSTENAFAALKADGSVLTWGFVVKGFPSSGDSSGVAAKLSSGVTQVFSSQYAFAALKADGSVVTWGWGGGGGDSSAVAAQLSSGVAQIISSSYAFAALKADGSVVTWGGFVGNSIAVAPQLSSGVTQIFATGFAFAALKADGSVVTWGSSGGWGSGGGDSSAVAAQLSSGVTKIYSNSVAFAALKADGSVVTWGSNGGDSSAVAAQLSSGVTQIFSTSGAFAALKADGSVVTWGDASDGGDSSAVTAQLSSGVTQIFSTSGAFAALKANGSVVTWGDASDGGDSSGVAAQLSSGVTQIFSTSGAFAALKANGSVVTWGSSTEGGNSNGVAAQLSFGVVGFANPFTDDRLLLPTSSAIITSVSDNFGAFQGQVANGAANDDRTPTISGTLSAPLAEGETVHIFNGPAFLGIATVDNTSTYWSYTPTLPASPDENYSLTARVSNASGDLGVGYAPRTFTLDTIAPTKTAAITDVSDDAGLIQGTVAAAGSTDDLTPTITGTLSSPLAAGETLRLFNGAALLGFATVDNTAKTWAYTPTLSSTASTSYSLTARVADAAGNLGVTSAARTFRLDSTAVISTVTDNVGRIRGQVAPGGFTDDTTPTISGMLSAPLAAGATLQLFNGATLLGSAVVNNYWKTWSFIPTLPATPGATYSIKAHVVDPAGNRGPASAARSFTLTTTTPLTTAVITSVGDNVGAIQGPVAPGGFTDDTTPTISGTVSAPLAAGESLLIFRGNTLLGSATVDNAAKTWTYAPTLPVSPYGGYALTARVSNGAGVLGVATSTSTFILDTTAPSLKSSLPLDGAIGVDPAANITLRWSEPIHLGSGLIQLRSGSATGPIIESFDAASSSRLSNSGAGLRIDPSSNLAPNTQYVLSIPAGALLDRAGNPYAGTSSYGFRTANVVSGTAVSDTLLFASTVDRITGLAGADTFRLSSLSDALLPASATTPIDRITDFATGLDSIDAPVARNLATALNPTAFGAVSDLSAAAIGAVLTPASFPALTTTSVGGAATFTFGTRTFLAINDGIAGFSATSDSILEITGFSGNLNQLKIF
ncbi:Ig-like domain-containing protein [Cyanobium sp. ULC082]